MTGRSPARALPPCGSAALRAFVATVLLLGLVLIPVSPAGAHSDFLGGDPAEGTNVVGPVETITLFFAVAINTEASTFEVIDGQGNPLEIAAVSTEDNLDILLTMAQPILDGAVGVGFTATSLDTHIVTGNFSFGVVAPPPTPTAIPEPTVAPTAAPEPTVQNEVPATADATPTPVATSTPAPEPEPDPTTAPAVVAPSDAPPPPDLSEFFADSTVVRDRLLDAQLLLRGLTYASAAVAAGALMFLLFVAEGRTDHAAVRRLSGAAAGVTALVTLAMVGIQGSLALGTEEYRLFDPDGWDRALTGNFRTAVVLRLIASVAVIAAVWVGIRRWGAGRRALGTGAAALMVISFPFFGHGVTRSPQWAVFPADLVHIAAVTFWTGGLVALVLVLRTQNAVDDDSRAAINRYSAGAAFALVATLLAGSVLAATELRGFSDLWDTSYGARLVVKLALVAGIIAMGAYHRFRSVPAVTANGNEAVVGRNRLVQIGALEIAVMMAVLVFSAFLVNAAT